MLVAMKTRHLAADENPAPVQNRLCQRSAKKAGIVDGVGVIEEDAPIVA